MLCEVFCLTQSRKEKEELHLGLRLNVSEDSWIGISLADFDETVSIAKNVCLKISELHFYRGTGTNATSAFTDVIDNVLGTAQKLPIW